MKVAIDPGKRSLAVAIIDGYHLASAFFLYVEKFEFAPWMLGDLLQRQMTKYGRVITKVRIERPQTYQLKHQKGDQRDIHDVSIVAGAAAMVMWPECDDIDFVLPAEWKGQITKAVTKARVDRALTPYEKASVIWPRGGLQHNVYDAIHLGLRLFTDRNV